MKTFALIAATAIALPMAALAQNTTAPASSAAAPAKPPLSQRVKTNTKKVVQKVVPKKIIKHVEENTPINDDTDVTLTEAQIKEAEGIYTGVIKCELGASVNIEADPKKPGFFTLTHNNIKYRLHPVDSRTGAVRLEDPRQGAMWLQLGNKSMLMSQKQGARLADDCQAAKQLEVAEDMKVHPPKGLLDDVNTTPPAAAAAPATKKQ
jgi:hypothetical protein